MALGTAPKRPEAGLGFKTLFTIATVLRYPCSMILIAAAAILAATPQSGVRQPAVTSQARATVRILAGARLRLGEEPADQGARALHSRTIHTPAGPQPAKLIEFE
jgi:hypothetical protein